VEPVIEPALVVVGLGNPGRAYAATRHNIGFRIVDMIAGGKPSRDFVFHENVFVTQTRVSDKDIILCKPDTYMNCSGDVMPVLWNMYRMSAGRLLIVCDDVALPLGSLRLRLSGSGGGQNGLQSVLDALGTKKVARLRCGIGPAPENSDLADFVLKPFKPEEISAMQSMVERAVEAVISIVKNGFDRTMTEFNVKPVSDNAPEAADGKEIAVD
jgi:PTH1 family peptidyl-tRNA hydrolase